MPRSLKKGPFVDEHLAKKVDAQNEKGTKNLIDRSVAAAGDIAEKYSGDVGTTPRSRASRPFA